MYSFYRATHSKVGSTGKRQEKAARKAAKQAAMQAAQQG